MLDCGPLWALCFYHFRCTMPTVVPAAAPFTSVSACLTTFMELIAPDLAHRHPHSHLLALYSLFNQWLSAFHRGLEELLEKMANCAPHSTPGCCCCSESVPRQCLLCPLIHSMPFSILSPSVVFLVCVPCQFCVLVLSGSPGLHSAWLVIFCTCSRLEYFMGLSAFS